jgi:hypothetical protein
VTPTFKLKRPQLKKKYLVGLGGLGKGAGDGEDKPGQQEKRIGDAGRAARRPPGGGPGASPRAPLPSFPSVCPRYQPSKPRSPPAVAEAVQLPLPLNIPSRPPF